VVQVAEIDRELRRGTLDLVLLKLLSEREMYGYQLITTLEERGGKPFQLKEGTLYPVLYRLEDAGFIKARWETIERGVPRKYYRLTSQGTQHLTALLREWDDFLVAINGVLNGEHQKRERP
jgi:PadR family transcriptional regulator PadR